jgi:signal transduction histidine kinase
VAPVRGPVRAATTEGTLPGVAPVDWSGTAGRPADELDILRKRTVAVVGHELRTPVTTIRGLAEELQRADLEEIRTELGPALLRSATRLERLLDDLLVASGVVTTLPVSTAVATPVAATARRAWSALGDGAVGLVVDGDAEAIARPGTLERVLGALLENAHRYGEPPVRVRSRTEDDRVVIEIESGGAPLPEGELEMACEPFFRGERAVTSAPGLGLGLALALGLVRHEGGDLTLRARPGGGVVATVELAAAP